MIKAAPTGICGARKQSREMETNDDEAVWKNREVRSGGCCDGDGGGGAHIVNGASNSTSESAITPAGTKITVMATVISMVIRNGPAENFVQKVNIKVEGTASVSPVAGNSVSVTVGQADCTPAVASDGPHEGLASASVNGTNVDYDLKAVGGGLGRGTASASTPGVPPADASCPCTL